MKLIFLTVMMFIISASVNADVNIKSCEDWDNDGRFGIVRHTLKPQASSPTVVRANVGTYASCLSKVSKIKQCKGRTTLCTCEDWDKDGRFGIVKNSNKKLSTKVVKGNIGNYYQCISYKNRKKYRNTSARYYSCEDWDKDGRFGLVKYNLKEKAPKPIVIKANYGNYYNCTRYKTSVRQCRGSSLCTCEDWNKDGRYGVVKYKGRKIKSKVLRSNVGTYAQCLSKIK